MTFPKMQQLQLPWHPQIRGSCMCGTAVFSPPRKGTKARWLN